MGEGADGDEVDTCGSDCTDAVEGDAAACFGEGATVDLLDGGPKVFNREVIQENRVDVGGKDSVDLTEMIDFDFEMSGVREC